MEWTIPLEILDCAKIKLAPIKPGPKPLAPFSYEDFETKARFPFLNLLLPALPIKSYEAATGRLVLGLESAPAALETLTKLQDIALISGSALGLNRNGFQSMIDKLNLVLYYPSMSSVCGIDSSQLVPGSFLRLVLRIIGISYHLIPDTVPFTYSGKFRLQHRITIGFFTS